MHSFDNKGADGIDPQAGVIIDGSGNLYGTTSFGGAYGWGIVFELTPKRGGGWTEKVLCFDPYRSWSEGAPDVFNTSLSNRQLAYASPESTSKEILGI